MLNQNSEGKNRVEDKHRDQEQGMGTTLLVTLKISGLDAPITRQRQSEWIKKQELTICSLQKNTV